MYDVTSYLEEHPGGPEIIMEFAGKEADDMFEDIGHSNEARQAQKKLLIGSVKVSSYYRDYTAVASFFFTCKLR